MANKEKSLIDYLENIESAMIKSDDKDSNDDTYLQQRIINNTKLKLNEINLDDIINNGTLYLVEHDLRQFNLKKKKRIAYLILLFILCIIIFCISFSFLMKSTNKIHVIYLCLILVVLIYLSIFIYKEAKRNNVFKAHSIWNYKNIESYVYDGKLKNESHISLIKWINIIIFISFLIICTTIFCIDIIVLKTTSYFSVLFYIVFLAFDMLYFIIFQLGVFSSYKNFLFNYFFIRNNFKLSHNDCGWLLDEV